MKVFSMFKKPKPSIAFGFEHGILKSIILERTKQGIQVIHHASLDLGTTILREDDTVNDSEAFVEILREWVVDRGFGTTGCEANVVIPDHHTIVFHTHVPQDPDRQMGDVIVDHLKTYCTTHLTLPFEDAICEYDIIQTTEFGYDLHVTLVPKRYVAHLTHLFSQAGITLPHIETAHHAVASACLSRGLGNGTALVDFGNQRTRVMILHDDHLVSQEVIPVGKHTLRETISSFLRVDESYAEKVLDRHGILPSHSDARLLGELYLTLAPIYQSIDRQIVAAGTQTYKLMSERFSVDTVLLYGSGIGLKGLDAFLSDKIQLPVHFLDIWAGSNSDNRAPVLHLHAEELPNYAEVLALALTYLEK